MSFVAERAQGGAVQGSRSQSLARRLTALSIGLVTVVVVGLALVVASVTSSASRTQVTHSVIFATEGLVSSVDSVEEVNRTMVRQSLQSFSSYFDGGTIDVNTSNGTMTFKGDVINGDFSVVDQFQKLTGRVATVFARKGDDFVRITTSIRNAQGDRAINTTLERTHPAYQLILQGQPYAGRAQLFGTPFMTAYQPMRNSAGEIIGILFVGVDLSDFQQGLQSQIQRTRLFDNGGVMVIDPTQGLDKARFVAHRSYAGQRVLDAVPNAKATLELLAKLPQNPILVPQALIPQQGNGPRAVVRATNEGWWVVTEVSEAEALQDLHHAQLTLALTMLAALVALALGLFMLLRRSVSAPLAELTSAITRVAQGDLTRAFHSQRKDEIGTLVREVENMRQRYVDMLRQVSSAAYNIASASSQISQGNMDLAERTENTATSLARTAQGMEEMNNGVRHAAESARTAHTLSSSAVDAAARGGQVVSQVVESMSAINSSSRQISDIIGVIDGIAFQTNILALNAAVEAARAGEQGRGFAVVAGEVRSLAQRSAEAAKQISTLIKTSVDEVTSGAALVQNAGQTMDEIVHSVQRVGDMISEISATSAEQAERMTQANADMVTLDQMTQQNAALVEEAAAASKSMHDQAAGLENAVAVFQLPASNDTTHMQQLR